jgi:hypothetical protein
MADAVPPIEEERADEPAGETFQHRHIEVREVKDRRAGKGADPELVGGERDRDLGKVDEDGARIPAARVGQLTSRPRPLEREEKCGGKQREDGRQSESHGSVPNRQAARPDLSRTGSSCASDDGSCLSSCIAPGA